jgi:DNA-binding response OmpR family regulator
MSVKKTTVLVVDDDVRMQKMMRRMLELEGYRVVVAATGEEALAAIDAEKPDAVLLDIMMPGMDGYETCRRIRDFSSLPVIMVTAKGQDDEKLAGFDAGADDYVTKPFSARELVARVKAVLRRVSMVEEGVSPSFQTGDLMVDFVRRIVTVGGKEVELTATEYAILTYLARNAGRILTPGQILAKVWGEEYLGETHLLQVNMARLRQKLGEDPKEPKYIQTRHGIGYMMVKR